MNFWTKTAVALLLVWAFAGAVIYFARKAKPTAASVTALVQGFGGGARVGASRSRDLARIEDAINRLPFEERQQLQRSGVTRKFFESLAPDEQLAFLDATLPSGFKQLMESFNKMEPERRRKVVQRALDEMKKREGEEPSRVPDEKIVQRVADEGLRAFYSEASADVKLDLAPLIEQMQKNLHGVR